MGKYIITRTIEEVQTVVVDAMDAEWAMSEVVDHYFWEDKETGAKDCGHPCGPEDRS